MLFPRLITRRLTTLAKQPSSTLLTRAAPSFALLTHLLKSPDALRALAPSCTNLRLYATRGSTTKRNTGTKTTAKKQPAKKPATKSKAKKKPAKKSAKKPAKKPAKKQAKKPKKPTSGEKLITAKVTSLRKIALLDLPKQRPTTVWNLYFSTHLQKGTQVTKQIKELGRQYRNLSPGERESLNQTAINNRLLNQRQYSDWIRAHSPDQVRLANNARVRLNRLSSQRHSGSKIRFTKRHPLLKDDRQLKRPLSGFMQYMADRWATGEFAGVPTPDVSRQVGREWKELGEAEKKRYNDEAVVRKEQYLTERAELYPSIAEQQQKKQSRNRRSTSSQTVGR